MLTRNVQIVQENKGTKGTCNNQSVTNGDQILTSNVQIVQENKGTKGTCNNQSVTNGDQILMRNVQIVQENEDNIAIFLWLRVYTKKT